MSKEFGDVFRFWLASIPTAAEAAEVVLAVVAAVLPYRGKSAAAGDSKIQIYKCKFLHLWTPFGGYLEETHEISP